MSEGRVAPLPPPELMQRVFGVAQWSDPARVYQQLGVETKSALLRLLPQDWSFEDKRVLDFGCGSGRTLRHFLDEAQRGEFWGADIDRPSIAWMRAALSPPMNVWQSAGGPPLGLEPGSFDLIWAISVFTHLSQTTSLPWLLELHRMLKPGGLLIATYHGRWNSEFAAGEEWDEGRIGMNVLQHNRDWNDGGPVVLMSDWWVQAHWGRAFEIVDRLERFHNFTWVVMRRLDVDLTPEELERPADDPREFVAVRHNLRQLQRELDLCAGMRAIREQTLRSQYETSLSWRLTRPLRVAAVAARERRRT